jgi:hypothetical protein
MTNNTQNEFKIYNYNFNFKVNDAVKVTSKHSETFWVEIKSINKNIITGKVLNKLLLDHEYDDGDIITFNKNNIKLVNPFETRNIMSEENKRIISRNIKVFNYINKRDPTEIEFEHFINTRIIPN